MRSRTRLKDGNHMIQMKIHWKTWVTKICTRFWERKFSLHSVLWCLSQRTLNYQRPLTRDNNGRSASILSEIKVNAVHVGLSLHLKHFLTEFASHQREELMKYFRLRVLSSATRGTWAVTEESSETYGNIWKNQESWLKVANRIVLAKARCQCAEASVPILMLSIN